MRRTFLLKTLALFLVLATAFAFEAEAQVARARNLDAKVPLSPKVTTGKFDNGFTYFIMENKKPENRVEIQLVIRAGSVQEVENQRGLAHFIEHMCFNGTKNFPKDALVKFLESTGVRFGADLNAYTSFDVTRYTLTIPLDKKGMFEQGMQVMEDWANWVSFDNEEIEKERGVILEEKRLRAGAQQRLMDQHFPVILKGSKYADRMPIGTEEVIKGAQRDLFLEFYNDWYRPDLAAVIVVGDIDKDEAFKLVKKHFENYSFRGKGLPKDKGTYPVPDNEKPLVSIAYDKELQFPNIVTYIKYPEFDKSTYRGLRELYKEQIFTQMFSMRLNELTKLPEPPYLYALAYAGQFIGGLHALNLVTVPSSGAFNKGFEAALGEMFRIDQHGFTESELNRAKEQILVNLEKQYNERDKTESVNLAQEIYTYFDHGVAMAGIEEEYKLVKEFLPDITVDEINQTLQKLIDGKNLVITASLPETSAEKPTEKEILDIYNKAKAKKYEPYVDELGDKPLMAKIPTPGKVVSTKKLPNFDITEIKLSNGARVLLKSTDYKNDQILFSCWANGGASLYSNLVDYRNADNATIIVDEGGLGEWDQIQLGKLLQSKVVRLTPYIGDYSQGMRGSTTPKDIETFFQLLHMQFTEPRKDSDAFKSYMIKATEAIKNYSREPANALSDTLQAVLNNYDPRKMPVTLEQLNDISLDKAFKIYQERFADASNFTFLFVGSFDIDEIKPFIEQYVASLPSTNKKETWKDMGIKMPLGKINKLVKKGIEPKATVRLAVKYDGKFEYTSENILVVNMLKEVFNIRLREVIREDKGGVYGIGAGISMNNIPTPNLHTIIYYGCAPERVEELIDAVKSVFEEMRSTEASKENIDKVKEILKKEFERNSKENDYWLSVIQQYERTGRDIAFLKNYEKAIDKVSAKDIMNAAKKYLTYDENFIRVVLMPEDDDE